MATKIPLAPDAQLLESMRAVGYSFSTALADIIDNSISADATTLRVMAVPTGGRRISILDNGSGMDFEEARTAMKLAGRSSTDGRKKGDLGRFGLGLKTASLSQGRVLTLATRKNGATTIFRWDLDHVASTGEWDLLLLERDEVSYIDEIDALESLQHGTLVVWEGLDSFEASEGYAEHLANELKESREHLGLVFHRFLDPNVKEAADIAIYVNNRPVQPATPLLENNRSTIPGPPQEMQVAGTTIKIRSFTLPHRNKMSKEEFKTAQIGASFRESQGFYVYRENRLVIWGTWFRMVPKQELGKLARVAVDIPNELDHLWSLDIKKSHAMPPPAVKERLRTYANRMIEPSKRVYTYKGRSLTNDKQEPIWSIVQLRDTFTVSINHDNSLIKSLKNLASNEDEENTINAVLALLESNVPMDQIFSRLGNDELYSVDGSEEELVRIARGLASMMKKNYDDVEKFVGTFINTQPFVDYSRSDQILRSSFESA